MNQQELQRKYDTLQAQISKTSLMDLSLDLGRATCNVEHAKEVRNLSWEKKSREELKNVQGKIREYKRLSAECAQTRDQLNKFTDPKSKGFTGPLAEETEEVKDNG